ncbi:MAG: hypothetical protein QOD57_924 [Actinomycetota bacterium]|jgi:hypothetical protein|nr:hypothetical protein [Actinomycetota bacterium]
MEMTGVQWSVGIEVSGDELMTLEHIGDLADSVAESGGIASGIGRSSYGVKVLVEGADRDEAVAKATEILRTAARTAGLPEWPVSRVEAVSEDEDSD